MDVGTDGALSGHTASLLVCGGEPLLAQELSGLVDVAAAGDERLLRVHHARARRLPQCLHQLGVHLYLHSNDTVQLAG